MDLLIIMTKYTLILAPLEVFAKRTLLGKGQGLQLSWFLTMENKSFEQRAPSVKLLEKKNLTYVGSSYIR